MAYLHIYVKLFLPLNYTGVNLRQNLKYKVYNIVISLKKLVFIWY